MEKIKQKQKQKENNICSKCGTLKQDEPSCPMCRFEICPECGHCNDLCNIDDPGYQEKLLEISPIFKSRDARREFYKVCNDYRVHTVRLCDMRNISFTFAKSLVTNSNDYFGKKNSLQAWKGLTDELINQNTEPKIYTCSKKYQEKLKEKGLLQDVNSLKPVLETLTCLGVYKRNIKSNDNNEDSDDFTGCYSKCVNGVCPKTLFKMNPDENQAIQTKLNSLTGKERIDYMFKNKLKFNCSALLTKEQQVKTFIHRKAGGKNK